jgi:hypothetical protein
LDEERRSEVRVKDGAGSVLEGWWAKTEVRKFQRGGGPSGVLCVCKQRTYGFESEKEGQKSETVLAEKHGVSGSLFAYSARPGSKEVGAEARELVSERDVEGMPAPVFLLQEYASD